MIIEEVIKGEIPSSMRVPLFDAKIFRIQYKGSDPAVLGVNLHGEIPEDAPEGNLATNEVDEEHDARPVQLFPEF
jgi:hypothetical protein